MRYDPKRGYVVLSNVIDETTVAAIVGQCDTIRNGPETELMPRDKLHGGTVHLERLAERIDAVNQLVLDPTLVQTVTDIVGPNFTLAQSSLRSPQPNFGQQQLHTDDVPKTDDGPCRVATAVVTLVPFSSDNGATRLVPGSHRRPDLQLKPSDSRHRLDEEIVTAGAGSAIIFSGHLLHSGSVNNSDSERLALQLLWHRQP